MAAEPVLISEDAYVAALVEAASYRALLLHALSLWSQDRRLLVRHTHTIQELMGMVPLHPENAVDDPGE